MDSAIRVTGLLDFGVKTLNFPVVPNRLDQNAFHHLLVFLGHIFFGCIMVFVNLVVQLMLLNIAPRNLDFLCL